MTTLVAAMLAYLIGSVSFAILASRAFGLEDPRRYGSGNPGATNVLRSGNKAAALMTLLLDAAKGWAPVAAAIHFGPAAGIDGTGVAAVALAAFLGHLYPIYFGFKGGKGVATALGVYLGVAPWLGLFAALTWLVMAVFFRYSSLASLTAALFAPFFYAILAGFDRVCAMLIVMAALIFYRHRKNIANLLAGRESRIGQKKQS